MLFMQGRSTSTWFMDRGSFIWAILSHSVYANGKQYGNVADLKTAIFQSRDNVTFDTIADLGLSMPDRVFKTILYHEKAIGH